MADVSLLAQNHYSAIAGEPFSSAQKLAPFHRKLDALEQAYASLAAATDKKDAKKRLRAVVNTIYDTKGGLEQYLESLLDRQLNDPALLGYLVASLHVLGPRLATPPDNLIPMLAREPGRQLAAPEDAIRRLVWMLRVRVDVPLPEEARFGPLRVGRFDEVHAMLESGRVQEAVDAVLSDHALEQAFLGDVFWSQVVFPRKEGGYKGGFTFYRAKDRDKVCGTAERVNRHRFRLAGTHLIIARSSSELAAALREGPKDWQLVGNGGEVDLSPIDAFPKLTDLTIVGAQVGCLDAVGRCPKLRRLIFETSKLNAEHLAGLSGQGTLGEVVITNSSVRSLAGLQDLRSLRSLTLKTEAPLALIGAEKLPKLSELTLTAPAFERLDGLSALTLKRLTLTQQDSEALDVSLLAKIKKLQEVVIRSEREPVGLESLAGKGRWEPA